MIKLERAQLSDGGIHIIVKGQVDSIAIRMVLDTGASHSVLDLNWVKNNLSHSEIEAIDDPAHGSDVARGISGQTGGMLDLVGFDACLMASLEVASAVYPYATYMIASEEFEPGVGWDWTALEYLAVEPAPTAIGLGEEIIESYHVHPVVASIPEHTLSMVEG